MRPLAVLLLLALATAAASAQDAPPDVADAASRGDGLVFTTFSAGITTGDRAQPFYASFLSVAAEHTRVRGWRTLRVGSSSQGSLSFTNKRSDGYAEVHVGVGATTAQGPLVLSATVGPSVGRGQRGVYGPGPAWPDRAPTTVRQGDRTGLALGLHATAQALLVVVPEVAVGIEASHDQNTFLPVSGARVVLSFGTHRRALVRF